MNDRFSLEGRVAIITGGGTGIGRGTALVVPTDVTDPEQCRRLVVTGRVPA